MPKKITLKNLNGTTINPSNVVGGHVQAVINSSSNSNSTSNETLAIIAPANVYGVITQL